MRESIGIVTICWYSKINASLTNPCSKRASFPLSASDLLNDYELLQGSPPLNPVLSSLPWTHAALQFRRRGTASTQEINNNNNVIDGDKLFITSPVITFKLIGKEELVTGVQSPWHAIGMDLVDWKPQPGEWSPYNPINTSPLLRIKYYNCRNKRKGREANAIPTGIIQNCYNQVSIELNSLFCPYLEMLGNY